MITKTLLNSIVCTALMMGSSIFADQATEKLNKLEAEANARLDKLSITDAKDGKRRLITIAGFEKLSKNDIGEIVKRGDFWYGSINQEAASVGIEFVIHPLGMILKYETTLMDKDTNTNYSFTRTSTITWPFFTYQVLLDTLKFDSYNAHSLTLSFEEVDTPKTQQLLSVPATH